MIHKRNLQSHPVGVDGQNHIIAIQPLKFLPIKEFEKRQKSIDPSTTLVLMNSMQKFTEVFEKKVKANELKQKGNTAFHKKKYLDAERLYSQAIELNIGSRPIRWKNLKKPFPTAIWLFLLTGSVLEQPSKKERHFWV